MQNHVLLNLLRVYMSPRNLFVSIGEDEEQAGKYGLAIGIIVGDAQNPVNFVLFAEPPFTDDLNVVADTADKFLLSVCKICRAKLESKRPEDEVARTYVESLLTCDLQRDDRFRFLNEEIIKRIVAELREEGHADSCPHYAA